MKAGPPAATGAIDSGPSQIPLATGGAMGGVGVGPAAMRPFGGGAPFMARPGGRGRRSPSNSANLPNEISQAEGAELVDVSTRSVTDAAKVRAHGTPDLIKAVEDDKIAVPVKTV